MADRKVILTIENVRVKEYDSLNVTVERLEEVYNPIEKESSMKWKFKGYSKGVLSALLFIQRNELLIDKNTVSDFKSYLKQVNDSNGKLISALEGASL